MRRRFAQVDVFGDQPGDGNPVAVVVDAEGLTDDQMAAFANWTNLSETTFLLPPQDPDATYAVRIFTPARELPFAGHPTLGSAHAWSVAHGVPQAPHLVQECGAGLIRLRRLDGRLAFGAPELLRDGPLDDGTLMRLCGMLGIELGEVVDHAWTDNGPGWATVLLESAERVLTLRTPTTGDLDVGVVGLHADGTPEVRAFAHDVGITEDPVTGSLNAGIAEWLLDRGVLEAPYVAHQGTALGRAGRVHVADEDGTVWVGGDTVSVIEGTVEL